MKSAWIGSGFSHQSVPSLSNTATRSSGGTSLRVHPLDEVYGGRLGRPVVPGGERLTQAQRPVVRAASSFSTAWLIVKLAASCRGGNSLNVSRNCVTIAVAARTM